jgi:hypothetical protein
VTVTVWRILGWTAVMVLVTVAVVVLFAAVAVAFHEPMTWSVGSPAVRPLTR